MRVKNVSGISKIYVGQTLTNNQEYDIPQLELFKWMSDTSVIQDASLLTLLIGDSNSNYKATGAEAVSFLLDVSTDPKDTAGRPIFRSAATIDGWHYQLLSCEVTTSLLNGFYCKDEDGANIGFITYKLYDVNGAEITDPANESQTTETRVWIRPTHSYEIIGAIFGQSSPPATDMWLFVTGLPGIANIKFSRGGINLKHLGSGTMQLADGRASKYLAYNASYPDANSFKFTVKHSAGTVHSFQITLETFKGA